VPVPNTLCGGMRITSVLLALVIVTLVLSAIPALAASFQVAAETNVRISTSTTKRVDLTLTSSSADTYLVRILEEKPWMSLSRARRCNSERTRCR